MSSNFSRDDNILLIIQLRDLLKLSAVPKKRPGVQRQRLDPDSVRPVPLPNRDGTVPPTDERAAKFEARKKQVLEPCVQQIS
jgi:hypothetical protein